MKSKKYGLMSCSRPLTNIGDFVQTIAARQFLPKVDKYIDREELNKYEGDDLKMIMNGWYMHNAENWPPSKNIDPLYVSMHINASVAEGMTSEKSIEHFIKNQPIGCRDKTTEKLLKSKGVEAYFSGCLTLTLGKNYKRDNITDDIYIVDPLFHYWSLKSMLLNPRKLLSRLTKGRFTEFILKKKVLRDNFTEEVLNKAQWINQMMPLTTVDESFKIADEYLKKMCNAKLVITSRIHCALPCIAMGTPVVFLNGGFEGYNNQFISRFEGLIDFFNRIDIDTNRKINRNFDLQGKIGLDNLPVNKELYKSFAEELEKKCNDFVTLLETS